MQTRKFDELISYFNRNVSNMDIDQKYKIELLGMITAIGFVHEKELHDPTIEPERKTGRWIHETDSGAWMLKCSVCECRVVELEYKIAVGTSGLRFCPYCGARMEGES